MSQMESGLSARPKPRNNVYTMLMLTSIIALGAGIGVLWWKNVELTGQKNNPFYVVPDPEQR